MTGGEGCFGLCRADGADAKAQHADRGWCAVFNALQQVEQGRWRVADRNNRTSRIPEFDGSG